MKTIGEYFSVLDEAVQAENEKAARSERLENFVEVVCFGYLTIPAGILLRWPYWDALMSACREAWLERADSPFRGGRTCADIMNAGKSRYLVKSGARYTGGRNGTWELAESKKVPGYWLSTTTKLEKLPYDELE